jgi:opacity protein-like surface antigen
MRTIIVAVSALCCTPLLAADLHVKAPPAEMYGVSWAGPYASIYGLYAANITNTTVTDTSGASADLASAPHGPGLGGSIGYYFQPTPNGIVFGPRVDLAYASLRGAGNLVNALSVSNATNYLGDADLILGLPLSPDGRFLGYIGGGFAFGGAKPNLAALGSSAAVSDTSTGWNVLGGLAYQLGPNWQMFIEGNYYQLGDKSLTLTDSSGAMVMTSLTKYHILEQKFGVSYKF